MTRWQQLFRVEWPLALPVLFTGVRTASTELIASATLAAFIGAGGLGEYILRGLQANDPRLIDRRLYGSCVARDCCRAAFHPRLAPYWRAFMSHLSRKQVTILIGAALVLPQCSSRRGNAVAVGSKNFTEEFIIAEIYAQALERAGLTVVRKFNLGSTQIAMTALRRGDIDLYPEYTGTALIDVLHLPPMHDPQALYRRVSDEFATRFALRWLRPSPMNDSQGLATTQSISKQYGIATLSQLSRVASQLRLGAIPEFLSRADALPGLQKYYGGFRFKDVKTYDIGLKYQALLHGDADIVTAFTTDGALAANNLVVLKDDKHFWPEYHIAPVVRIDALRRAPAIAAALNRIAPAISDAAARSMNYAVDVKKQDSADVASAFLKGQRT